MASTAQVRVARTDPCPCGSGRRYKHCCGALEGGLSLQELMYSALQQQRAGALGAAEGLYRRALAVAPDNFDCLHMLGVICYQTRRSRQAFDLIRRALDLTQWQVAAMRYNLGLVVTELMRDPDAYGESAPGDDLEAALRTARERLAACARSVVQHALDDDTAPFGVPRSDDPHVSIVIPAYGQHRYTQSCIRSIVEHTAPGRYEIVVVDDASEEPVAVALSHASGVRIVRNAANAGFIASCNRGAEVARGEVLVLLNNDTLVTAGWLEALLAALQQQDVGLVGAKLVYPDGSLQEAGGILFRNGAAANCGRNDDASKPEYNYLRDVDYCSGACLAIRREAFLALGGFDAHFAPAYYEDADLAMRVRAAGRRIVYQPAATVVHFEGATGGRNTEEGEKRYQAQNRAKFEARWREALAGHRALGVRGDLGKDRDCRARILVVDANLPTPDKDAGSVRIVALMQLLVRARCKVTFAAQSLEFVEGYARNLQQAGIEVLHFPHAWSLAQIIAERGADLDLIWASRHEVAANCVAAARRHAPQALFVLDTVDLHFLREEREAALTGSETLARRAERTRANELGVARRADVTLVVSDAERDLLAAVLPDVPVVVLSNVHDVRGRTRDFAARRDILFIGGFNHPPNVDAVLWLARDIWPLVRTRLPEARLLVVGSNMPAAVKSVAGNGIEAIGHVADLEPYLDGCRLSVAPLRFGAGVKGKITTAQARGVPVVATTLAVEGMHLADGRDVLVADGAADFADAVVRLYGDASLWTRISDAGIEHAARHFSPDAVRAPLEQLVATALARRARATKPAVNDATSA